MLTMKLNGLNQDFPDAENLRADLKTSDMPLYRRA